MRTTYIHRGLLCEVLNSELPHLVNEIQTQLLWLKHISVPEWLKIHHYWTYSCHITWNLSSRCIVGYSISLNNIMRARHICRTTFEKKIRKFWVCQWIIKVLKAILWFKGNKNLWIHYLRWLGGIGDTMNNINKDWNPNIHNNLNYPFHKHTVGHVVV